MHAIYIYSIYITQFIMSVLKKQCGVTLLFTYADSLLNIAGAWPIHSYGRYSLLLGVNWRCWEKTLCIHSK